MRVVTLNDLVGAPDGLTASLAEARRRGEELMHEVVNSKRLLKADAPLACWFEYADAEVRYCTEIETWVLAAQGKSAA